MKMEENKETLEPQELGGQNVTDNVTEETVETSEDAASPEGKQPAEKRWRFTTERVKVTLLAVIAACLVIIVFQNFFPSECEVSGNMWLDGGYVSVDGGYVNVGGEVSVGNLGSTTDFQSGLIRASYNVGSDAIPVKLVGVEINDLNKEKNCVPIDIRMVRGYDVNYSSYGVPVKVK